MIPKEAIEAAAAAIQVRTDQPLELDELARAALEAAAPHMLADAWELGMVTMYATTGGEWPLIPEQNPYRPTP